MKTFILYHFPVILQQVHAQLQMLAAVDVLCHHAIVGPVQEYLSKKLDRLSLRHVRVRLDQDSVVLLEKHVEIDVQELSNKLFVFRKDLLCFC